MNIDPVGLVFSSSPGRIRALGRRTAFVHAPFHNLFSRRNAA
jgi:hypothetical protein